MATIIEYALFLLTFVFLIWASYQMGYFFGEEKTLEDLHGKRRKKGKNFLDW